jgi:hypothetical protein
VQVQPGGARGATRLTEDAGLRPLELVEVVQYDIGAAIRTVLLGGSG